METERPWLDLDLLAAMLADWRARWSGRKLFRTAAGPDWIRLHLAGDERPAILLTCLPGAAVALSHLGRLPEPVHTALAATRQHPLGPLLAGAELVGCGLLPADRVVCLDWADPRGRRLTLLHQLFGSRGNTALVDPRGKLLWAWRRPPHLLLTVPPAAAVWEQDVTGPPADRVSAPALDHLAGALARRSHQEAVSWLSRHLRSTDKLVTNLTRDLDRAERGDEFRLKAEALAAGLHLLTAGMTAARIPDPRTGTPLVIDLDPALGPAGNLEAWFKKARKAEKGRAVIASRLETARGEQAALTAARDALPDAGETSALTPLDRLDAIQAWEQEYGGHREEASSGSGRRAAGSQEPGRPFRRYLIDGRWEVWVGRHNRENDALTHRAAHHRDLWFHAQGVSGSHVILRTAGRPEQVPKVILAKAAALAAQNSKARHASLVPVVYTEKRYVRKPRKAPAGTAVCLREKSLFVKPGVPPGAVSI